MRMFCASMTSLICGHHADVSGGGTESKKGKRGTDTLLEGDQVALCERVCLGNHRDKVDAGTETFRNLSVEWLKTKTGSGETQIGIRRNVRVTSRPDEVQASVNTKVALLAALGLLLLNHVRLMLVVNKVDDGRPRVAVVDVVTKTGGVNHGELNLERLLLELSLDDLDFGELVELLVVASVIVFRQRKLGGEECIDKSGLPQTRLALINR